MRSFHALDRNSSTKTQRALNVPPQLARYHEKMSRFLSILGKVRKNKTVRAVGLVLLALYFVVNTVQFARDLPDVPGSFFDYVIWRDQNVPDWSAIMIGFALGSLGVAMAVLELTKGQWRSWLAQTAAVCWVVGALVLASLVSYKTVDAHLMRLTAAVGEAHAFASSGKSRTGAKKGSDGSGYTSNPSGQEPEAGSTESPSEVQPEAFKSEAPSKEFCGCPPASPSLGGGGSRGESFKELGPEEGESEEEFEGEEEEEGFF